MLSLTKLAKRAFAVTLLTSLFYGAFAQPVPVFSGGAEDVNEGGVLAPTWNTYINRWTPEIEEKARQYKLDPDLAASVIWHESRGFPDRVSYAGAVGLMGIMPYGDGFLNRPSADALLDPLLNIHWGNAILADIIKQSGGDVHAALAAYNGGWQYATYNVPRTYAADVLNDYGRAIAARAGVDPDSSGRWTVAFEVNHGYISAESYLAGGRLVEKSDLVGETIAFNGTDKDGMSYFVKAYAVALNK